MHAGEEQPTSRLLRSAIMAHVSSSSCSLPGLRRAPTVGDGEGPRPARLEHEAAGAERSDAGLGRTSAPESSSSGAALETVGACTARPGEQRGLHTMYARIV